MEISIIVKATTRAVVRITFIINNSKVDLKFGFLSQFQV